LKGGRCNSLHNACDKTPKILFSSVCLQIKISNDFGIDAMVSRDLCDLHCHSNMMCNAMSSCRDLHFSLVQDVTKASMTRKVNFTWNFLNLHHYAKLNLKKDQGTMKNWSFMFLKSTVQIHTRPTYNEGPHSKYTPKRIKLHFIPYSPGNEKQK